MFRFWKTVPLFALLVFASCGSLIPIGAAEPIKTTRDEIAELRAELKAEQAKSAKVAAELETVKARMAHGEAFATRMAGYKPLEVGSVPAKTSTAKPYTDAKGRLILAWPGGVWPVDGKSYPAGSFEFYVDNTMTGSAAGGTCANGQCPAPRR